MSKKHFIKHTFPWAIVFKAQFRILDKIIEEKRGCYKKGEGHFMPQLLLKLIIEKKQT